MLDTVSLLSFPSFSNGLSAYKSNLNVSESFGARRVNASSSASSSDSPPRKTLRLDNNEGRTTRSKGKEKASDVGTTDPEFRSSVQKLEVVNAPENDISDEFVSSLQRKILEYLACTLDWENARQEMECPSRESVYQATRTLVVIKGLGRWIFDKLKQDLNKTAAGIAQHLKNYKENPSINSWLTELLLASNWFKSHSELLSSTLTYLDRVYLLRHSDLQSITKLSMQLFETHVFHNREIGAKFTDSITEWARQERTKRAASPQRETIKQLCELLYEFNLFTAQFLESYVETTRSFYELESKEESEGKYKESPTEFLDLCHGRVEEEQERSKSVLTSFPWCWGDIRKATEEAYLQQRLVWLSEGVGRSITSQDTNGLRLVYYLFSKVGGLKLLCETFKRDVQKAVSNIVLDEKRDEEMVQRLVEFKEYINQTVLVLHNPVSEEDSIATSAPQLPNRDFINAASDAFQAGFRGRKNKPAEMIAKYLDRAMRKGQQGESDEDFDKQLSNVLGLYHYTQDKDVFRTFYHKALARRLLANRSASDDFEKAVLKKLKEQYDPEFSMGDQMFRDLALSRDIIAEFHFKPMAEGSAQNLTVMVLQRSFWPFAARTTGDIALPPSMQEDLSKYTLFYKNAHKGHKLDFDHSLGTAQMRGRFNAGPKELTVSLYQAVILLMFNDEAQISYADIKENTRLKDDELKRTLQSLACGKKKVIKKQPPGKDVNDTDVFIYNADFTDPKAKVHINSILVKETPEESQKTQSAIEGDRKHYLDAAIVRIMKAKKNMLHTQLINETITAVHKHFAPDTKMMKERIEQLIEQEYMRRDDETPNMYVYVA